MQKIKNVLLHIFDNDASSARPEDSMEVIKLYWWEHTNKSGQYPAAKVHRSLSILPNPSVKKTQSVNDYVITVNELPGLEPEILTH
jgi:CRISPR-associated protein Csd2